MDTGVLRSHYEDLEELIELSNDRSILLDKELLRIQISLHAAKSYYYLIDELKLIREILREELALIHGK